MEMTLAEAVTATGLSKPGLLKAIKSGRLSATKGADGKWKLDSSEVFRVYKPVNRNTVTKGDGLTPEHPQVSALMARLEAAEDRRRSAEARADELRRDLDAANGRIDILLRALPAGLAPVGPAHGGAPSDPGAVPDALQGRWGGPGDDGQGQGPAGGESAKKRGWWSRLFGTGGHSDGQ